MVEKEERPPLPIDAVLRLGDSLNRLNGHLDRLAKKCDHTGRNAHCQDTRISFRRYRDDLVPFRI
jgi:hypothetical protein